MNSASALDVVSTDGVRLAVYESGSQGNPIVVAVHGYPDNHSVWDGVVGDLSADHRVVTYDVRGAGASDRPVERGRYRIPQLVEDLRSVLDAVSPDEPVHLLAHDWGSIQTWEAVTDESFADRLLSFTSVSGPSLDMTGVWLRNAHRHPGRALGQLLDSYYIAMFQLPILPERLASWGAISLGVRLSSRRGRPRGAAAQTAATPDAVHGIALYRANLARLVTPAPRKTTVPVQILAPNNDMHVSVAVQTEAPRPYVADLRTRVIQGNHWVVAQRPEVIARCVREFAAYVNGAPLPRALDTRPGRFGGKLVVVTGGARGIGRATALEFARKGADIIIADINETAAKETAIEIEALGVAAAAYHLDVSDGAAWEEFAAAVHDRHGVPDILVNNAGIGIGGAFLDTGTADWENILGVNLWSVIHGSRLFGSQMAQRGEGGRIVNIASAAAFAPSRFMSAYTTTKAAVLMLSECLHGEFAAHGVAVTAICPGFVDSDISSTTRYVGLDADQQSKLRQRAMTGYRLRSFSPERLARHAVRAVERGDAVAAIGAETHVLRAMYRFAPGLSRLLGRVDISTLG